MTWRTKREGNGSGQWCLRHGPSPFDLAIRRLSPKYLQWSGGTRSQPDEVDKKIERLKKNYSEPSMEKAKPS